MKASLRHRLGWAPGIVTLAVGLGGAAMIRSVSSVYTRPVVIAREAPAEPLSREGEFANSAEQNLKEIKLVCNDDSLRPFWIDLLYESRFTAQLLSGQLQNIYDCSELLSLEEVDLNDDGINECKIYMGSAYLCGLNGNCPFAVYGVFHDERSFMKTSAGTFDFSRRKLLYSEGNLGFEIQKSKTNGYRDLLLRFNGGNYDNFLRLYKFDGSEYQVVRCYEETKPGLERVRATCD